MPKGQAIDMSAVHHLLWDRSDRLGRLRLTQKELATELGVTHFAVSRLFKRMEQDGRMKKLTGHQGNTWTYTIRNPENFA